MVVDSFIRHWVMVEKLTEPGTGGLGLTIIYLAAYLYAEDVLVAPTQPERLHRAFDVLTGLFDRLGLRKNTAKMIGMVCQPCHVPGGMSDEAYARRATGKGPTFQERHQRRLELTECGV